MGLSEGHGMGKGRGRTLLLFSWEKRVGRGEVVFSSGLDVSGLLFSWVS